MAQNALTGSLPPCWAGLASLASLDASGNYLSGALPEGWKDLATLQEIRLANNNLAVRQGTRVAGASPLRSCSPGPSCAQGNIPPSWARLPSLMAIDLGSNVGVCGAPPEWQAGVRVHIAATNIGQSCIMVNTSSTLVGAVLGQ